ncbi:hypothetical protein M1116_01910 [Patescibacteria group bacterium]|nr:hypothetical protein [Patescibacteria group bacterium]
MNNKVTILGEVITKKDLPKLYKWAKENPATLVEQLKSIADKWHEGNIRSALIAFEMDLERI